MKDLLACEGKEVYVALFMLYAFESCYVKKVEEQVKTMCKSLTCEWKTIKEEDYEV